ncbi:MAG TPA: DNA topoisomerase IB [Cyclobacteriaceae bacterium]|jgi:DNA topoisomerase-1|nr:DNA topoisomerase IB [Cyclobacteriaceae bacterium]
MLSRALEKKGISRKRKKMGNKKIAWDYFDEKGKLISDQKVKDRCNKLVLPPAWVDVWISPSAKADLQATGKDAKGRLQYRYHENWTKARAEEKFDSMTGFARMLIAIRKKVDTDLKLEGMPKDKVVALIIKLIDLYHFRVGNDEYAKTNESYGLTTLKEGHMTLDRSASAEGEMDAIFEFKGKSGKMWKRRIWEDDLVLLIKASGEVGGRKKSQDLFRYEDKNGNDFDIKSNHINEYLDEITSDQEKVTAKDFRTWAATWKTVFRLSEQLDPDTAMARKRVLNEVIKTVSYDLGNTPTVCRSSYIHPIILSDWTEGSFRSKWSKASRNRKLKGLSSEETTTLYYLK